MTRDSVLARGRARVQESFTETVQVGTLARTANEHHVTVEVIADPLYDGAATVEYLRSDPSVREAAGQAVTVQTPILKVPVDSVLFALDSTVIVSASISDPSLVGRRFTIAGSPDASQVVCHRYPLKEYR